MKKIMLVAAMAVALALSMVAGAAAAEGTYETYTITVTEANGSDQYAHEVTLVNDCDNEWSSESDFEPYQGGGEVNDSTYTATYQIGTDTFTLSVELLDDNTLGDEEVLDNPDVTVENVRGTWSSDSEPCGEPTAKDDCKDGGWEGYGYRNQGQCVSDVATA